MKWLRRGLIIPLIVLALLQPACEFVAGSVYAFLFAIHLQFDLLDGVDTNLGAYTFADDFDHPPGHLSLRFRVKMPDLAQPCVIDAITLRHIQKRGMSTINTFSITVPVNKKGKGKVKKVFLPLWHFLAGDTLETYIVPEGGDIPTGSQILVRERVKWIE